MESVCLTILIIQDIVIRIDMPKEIWIVGYGFWMLVGKDQMIDRGLD
jgi:hypothetical protein